jgi:hypothetical protein
MVPVLLLARVVRKMPMFISDRNDSNLMKDF